MSEKRNENQKTRELFGDGLISSARAVVVDWVLADASTFMEDTSSPDPAPPEKKETRYLEARPSAARRKGPPAATIRKQNANGSDVDMKTPKQKIGLKSQGDKYVSTFNIMDVVHERAALATGNEESNRSGTDTLDPPSSRSEPGAFMGAPGRKSLHRRENVRFSLIGVGADHYTPTESIRANEDDMQKDGRKEENETIMMDTHHNTVGLAEATPVEHNITPNLEAQPFDVDESERRKSLETRKHRLKLGLMVIFVVAAVATVVGFFLRNNTGKDSFVVAGVETTNTSSPAMSPTASPTRHLPSMENLEILYQDLPGKTKESLYNNESPQYMAWEWLLDHPNITAFPEWRKMQIFALATIFFAFEGPNWPEETPARSRWMDVNSSECDWIASDYEVALYVQQANLLIGPDAYKEQDWQPCNEDGELQSFILHQLFLPSNLNPTIPPEIGLLTSLKILGSAISQLNTMLSDLLVPELIRLPNLEGLNFRSNGAHGTIPKEISLMTGLRHLVIGANALTGTIPSGIGAMTSLEYLNVGDEDNLTGELPSELGLMTKLTGLSIYRTSITGTLPTELGLLIRLRKGFLDNNQMGGTIPSELGLWTNAIALNLGNNYDWTLQGFQNNFTGSLPMELWNLSHLESLSLAQLPYLHGRIPRDIVMLNLTMLSLSGSPHLSGTIPKNICFVVDQLEFDCSNLLCGCYCPCIDTAVQTNNWDNKIPP